MPWLIASVLARRDRPRERASQAARPGGALVAIGWAVALIAIFGAFLGGAGIFMIAAGHLVASTLVLAVAGTISVLYLAWFLGFGPGAGAGTEERPASLRRRGRRLAEPRLPEPARCSLCGIVEHDANHVIATGASAICERCIASAMPKLSPYWATRGRVRREGSPTT